MLYSILAKVNVLFINLSTSYMYLKAHKSHCETTLYPIKTIRLPTFVTGKGVSMRHDNDITERDMHAISSQHCEITLVSFFLVDIL